MTLTLTYNNLDKQISIVVMVEMQDTINHLQRELSVGNNVP